MTCGASTWRPTPGRDSRLAAPGPRLASDTAPSGRPTVAWSSSPVSAAPTSSATCGPTTPRQTAGASCPATIAPKARYGSCIINGSDGRLSISHGFTFAGRFDDTRAYDLATERWSSIAPDGRRPGERCLHDCFTSATGQLVLFGGQDNATASLGDLWVTRTDGSWQRKPDPRAAARRLYAVARQARTPGSSEVLGSTTSRWATSGGSTARRSRRSVRAPQARCHRRAMEPPSSRTRHAAGFCSSAGRDSRPRQTSGN